MMPLEAHRALLRFWERRGTAALRLLLHAAVPQSFRPDLLTLIRANFVPEAKDHPEAEADVMLAPFCLGSGFFQLDNEIRRQCLDHLADLGAHSAPIAREQRVAMLLLAFIERCEAAPGLRDDPLLVDWLEVQRWVVSAFLDPDATAMGLASALSASVRTSQPVAAAQLGAATAAVSLPLSNYPTLITYALGLGALKSGDRVTGQRLLGSVADEDLRFGSVELPPPEQLLRLESDVEEVVEAGDDHEETVPASSHNPAYGQSRAEDSAIIFLSYARVDDELPPSSRDRVGWVRFFRDNLSYELRQRLAQDLRIWADETQLEPASDFAEEVEKRIQEARLFIPILSPNYLSRSWCQKELKTFLKFHPDLDRTGPNNGLLAVYKHAIGGRDSLPVALQNRCGYRFFEVDPGDWH
jgi:TIR domain